MNRTLLGLGIIVVASCSSNTANSGAGDAGSDVATAPPTAACAQPNPLRGTTDDLMENIETVADNGFENGTSVPTTDPGVGAKIERRADAAHTGNFGYRVDASAATYFEVEPHVDKGDTNVFSVWVRSRSGTTQPRLVMRFPGSNSKMQEVMSDAVDVGDAWTQLTLTYSTTTDLESARVGIKVPQDATVDVDDISAKAPWFKWVSYPTGGRTVGSLTVPEKPRALTHFAVLIHIEDGSMLPKGTEYFAQKSEVFEAIANIMKSHGGYLTIQPEREWALGANAAAARDGSTNVLKKLADTYNVHYSTHTHGPACVEENGTTHNGDECKGHSEWTSNPITPAAVAAYALERKQIIEAASGTKVTDHNGNFDAADWGPLAQAGFTTMSAYKDHTTQRMLKEVFNNPWRVSNVDGIKDPTGFEKHNPSGPMIYVPGVGQSVPRYHPYVPEYVSRAISQFVAFADPERVNTLYVVLHVDHYASTTGLRPDVYMTSDEFKNDIGVLDTLLTNTVDPLVNAGYLKWSSLADTGQAFSDWERSCGAK